MVAQSTHCKVLVTNLQQVLRELFDGTQWESVKQINPASAPVAGQRDLGEDVLGLVAQVVVLMEQERKVKFKKQKGVVFESEYAKENVMKSWMYKHF